MGYIYIYIYDTIQGTMTSGRTSFKKNSDDLSIRSRFAWKAIQTQNSIYFLNLFISNGLANNRHRTPKNRSKTGILSVILKLRQLQNVNLFETCSCYRRSEN